MKFSNFKLRIFTSFILILLILLIFMNDIILTFSLIILGNLSILEFSKISKKILKNKINLLLINLFFISFIFIFCIFFFIFSSLIQLKIILYSLLFGCIASDIGGYLFGKIFKGPKLTKISPNKTFSGSFGSIILSCFVISSLIYYFTNNFNYKILIISVLTSIFCQLGDLFFSYLKRKAKIKNTGNFLPGHGGILDRLDGIFLGLPLGFVTLTLLY